MHHIVQRATALVLALCLTMVPAAAFAVDNEEAATKADSLQPAVSNDFTDVDSAQAEKNLESEKSHRAKVQAKLKKHIDEQGDALTSALVQGTDKVLSYDKSDIKTIGTQEKTGHSICCPSFSCAYGDAVIDGTVRDHSYYTCSCCTWNDWGGGGSWNRHVGTDEELLREAYDQISSGKPTVIHVSGGSGEHWICLIGYKNATDPDHLALSNFIALDPWDGAQITASSRYALYGDGCEHISDR